MKYICNKCNEHVKKENMNFDTEYDSDYGRFLIYFCLCDDCIPNEKQNKKAV